jgi:hypothetical protein
VPDNPGTYRFSEDEPPRRRRYVPPPGADPHPEFGAPEPSPLGRFAGLDPLPFILAVVAVLWVGLGLATGVWPWMGLVLAGAGLLVCLAGQVYLHWLIFREDERHGWLSLFSDWYRVFYLHQNPELTWRPMLVTACGLLMILTGVALFLAKIKPAGP